MISKLVPPLNGLTGLVMVTSCTIDGVTRILFLVLISIDMKLGSSYLKLGEVVWYACSSNW
jgi:hypothetical protein